MAALLASTGELRALAETTVALLLAVFATVNVTVLVVRARAAPTDQDAGQHFRVPAAVPVVGAGACACASLLVYTLVEGGTGVWLRLGLMLLGGLLLAGAVRFGAPHAP